MSEDLSASYVVESIEQLSGVERNLLALEQGDEPNTDLVNEIFRAIHTIKGGADYLGLEKVKALSHAAEDVLDMVRKEKIVITHDGIDTLLVVTDTLKEMLQKPDAAQSVDISHLLQDVSLITAAHVDDETVLDDFDKEEFLLFGTLNYPDIFQLSRTLCKEYKSQRSNLYILELDSNDSPLDTDSLKRIFEGLVSTGYILESKTTELASDFNDDEPHSVLHILFRSVLVKTTLIAFHNVEPRCLREFKEVGKEPNTVMREVSDESTRIEEQRIERRDDRRRDNRRDVDDGRRDYDEADALKEKSLADINYFQSQVPVESSSQAITSIRVSVDVLDDLMNLVGELVLTRNQLKQNIESNDFSSAELIAQRLDIVTSELQESVMSTRMQPLGSILTKFHRIIRDMSNQLGKSVNLILEGEDVELDKSIIENISDPLTHLVRNAIDHGIESADERHRKNKPAKSNIAITARQEAGHVVIEISDDGRGIDKEEIKEKALEIGLIDKAKAEEMTEKEILKLIFTPGFSTAKVVSDISGRGVGLDVVLTNIARLGGTVDIDTTIGKGTTFKISMPLTLAIVPSLLVSIGTETFAIPQINLVELVRIPVDQKSTKIHSLGDSVVVRLRDKLLPIVWLDKILGFKHEKDENQSVNIAVVASGDYHYGIVVNQFTDSEEIVVKPLGSHLRGCRAYASATILGDGSAALILDVNGIADLVNISTTQEMVANLATDEDEKLQNAQDSVGEERSLLIVTNGDNEYFGIDLSFVNRIERINVRDLEKVAQKTVIQYRGGILRIFNLNEAINADSKIAEDGHVYLIVFYMMGAEVAVMVSNIVDIVDTRSKLDTTTDYGAGIIGTSIVNDRITLLVDLFELVKVIDPSMRASTDEKIISRNDATVDPQILSENRAVDASSRHTVLIVEDSIFFQDKLSALLTEMGITALVAEDGKIGWEMLNAHADSIELILMDVEMPNMTGIELCQLLRADDSFQDIPVIMLSSLAKESDVAAGKKAGANEYLIKMDQEMVRHNVHRYLNRNSVPTASSADLNSEANGDKHD